MSASLLSGAAAGCRCARDPAVGSGMPCLAVAHGLFLHLDQRLHWVLVCRLGPGRLVRRERCRAHMVCAGARLLADDALRLVPRRLGCRQLQRAGQLCGVPRPQLSSALAPLAAPALGASRVVRGGVPARAASLAARANARRAAWLRALLLLACAAAAAAACRVQTGPARAQSWADVYYFCGPDLQYCTCDFTWNARGWGKALLLWNFVLTAALVRPRAPRRAGPCARPRARCPRRPAPPRATLSCRARPQGLQKLVIQVGLGGLLAGAPPPPGRGPAPAPRRLRAAWPGAAADARARVCACARGGAHARARRGAGEEVVTKESFISICWRLIPYWLNNWEQRWGAEVSSMTFELPHFAMELLVVLPVVQARGPPAAAAG